MADPLTKLANLSRTIRRAEDERPQAIRDARAAGHTWEQIAEAAGMSRAGAIKASQRKPSGDPT